MQGFHVGERQFHDIVRHRTNYPIFWGRSSSYLEGFDSTQSPCHCSRDNFFLATPVKNSLEDLHVTVDGVSTEIFVQIVPSYRFQNGRSEIGYWRLAVKGIDVPEDSCNLCDSVCAVTAFGFRNVEEPYDELFDEEFVGARESLSPVGDKFCDNSVVLSAAGFGAVFAEVEGFPFDSDKSPVGGFVEAVFGKLFSGTGGHRNIFNKVSLTLYIRTEPRLQIWNWLPKTINHKDLRKAYQNPV
jgi:hypothetical protein